MAVPEIIRTSDGSDTLYVPELNQHYHSTFGAIQESQFIFIGAGLTFLNSPSHLPRVGKAGRGISILEIGFGTGLNALLTQINAEKSGTRVLYTSIEAYPIQQEVWSKLNYPDQLGSDNSSDIFTRIHEAAWGTPVDISPKFTILKMEGNLEDYAPDAGQFDLVYFDAFGPDAQPELWTDDIFGTLYASMKKGGVMVTYSVKGTIVRAIRSAGFSVEKLPGPPGKRHILRAIKP